MRDTTEPRNPFYFLLMLVCLIFVATCLAYVVVPWLEDKAAEAGQEPPPSAWRESLRHEGGTWLLGEVALIAFFAICGMGLDRVRSLRKERQTGTIPPPKINEPSQSPPAASGG